MSTSLIRVRPKIEDQVLSSFLLYYFWSPIAQSFAKASSKGTTREGTNSTIVEKLPLALAPVNEQKRIVSKVEELFSFLDTGAESLHKVQAQLKRYRQAVLKYAFEGKLTEEWRRANKGKLESAQRLLDKIRKDKMDFEKGKYKETPLSEITTLSKLPDLWVWTILGNIISVHSGEGLTKNKMAITRFMAVMEFLDTIQSTSWKKAK